MKRIYLLLTLIILALFNTCEDRIWDNPDDERSNITSSDWAPTKLKVDIIDNQSLYLTWVDNSNCESGYRIERSEEGTGFTEIADLSANTESYKDQGLNDDILYMYRIYAFSVQNQSDYSDIVADPRWVTDIEGNMYHTVKIGNQWWMAENLKVTHFCNGDAIFNVTDQTEWVYLTTSAYCNYDNNASHIATYGRLYNWHAVNDSRNIAPADWHVPSDDEWQTLVDYLGGKNIAGGKMKEVGIEHWDSPNEGATNESGFSTLPGGCRSESGNYIYMGFVARFWSSSENSSTRAWGRALQVGSANVDHPWANKQIGYSVRCVKN